MSAVAIASNNGKSGADFVVASYDGIHLLFHECEVRSVEVIGDIELPATAPEAGFRYRRGEDECPVFALDKDLAILPALPAQRQHFILLAGEGGDFGIACDQTSLLRQAEARLLPLPECMQSELSPVRGVTLIADAVGFYCPPSALAASLFSRRE